VAHRLTSQARRPFGGQTLDPVFVAAFSTSGNRSRWNRFVQIALSLIVIALIAAGAANAAATDMRSLWAGFGWALMSVAYTTFICQLRRAHEFEASSK
jgi:hypothetical protein